MADLKNKVKPLDERSRALRRRVVEILRAGRRGHIGASFSLIEIMRVLYDDILKYDSKNPKWDERDRLILSKGHGCLALYTLLQEKGFFPEEELWKFCKADGILGGHPEYGKVPGVEASTGSLGHGLSIGVGFALAARYAKSDRRVFVIMGDGESNEGSVWEAAMCAGKHKLSNLTVLVDYNKQQSCGTTFEIQNMEPFTEKWKSFGFSSECVDGHDVDALRAALKRVPFDSGKPTALICDTIKGKGVDFTEGDLNWHHKSKVTDEDVAALLKGLEARS